MLTWPSFTGLGLFDHIRKLLEPPEPKKAPYWLIHLKGA